MGDNLYVLEVLMRSRVQEFHAAAARDRLLAGLPRRPTLARRAVAAALGLMRVGGHRSTALTAAEHSR
jgi:hypothetical protein